MTETKTKMKKTIPSLETLQQKYENLEEPLRPIEKRYWTNSTTIEKLQELQAENPRGILVFADEITRLLNKWDSPGRESDRAYFIEGWEGGRQFYNDTIGRGSTRCINTLSVLGSTQPDKMQRFLLNAMQGDNDGLIQRFQLSVFPDRDQWQWVDEKPNAEAAKQIYSLLARLDKLDYEAVGAELDSTRKFHYLRFSQEATEVFKEWLTELQTVIIPNEPNPLIAEHLAKYPSLFASLAIIFCLVRILAGGLRQATINKKDAELAAAWCGYLELHARKIYALVNDAHTTAVFVLNEAILSSKLQDGFTARDVRRKGWAGLNKSELVEYACDELCKLNRLANKESAPGPEGGAPTIRYFVNPKLFASDKE